jgi:hypothetical protein
MVYLLCRENDERKKMTKIDFPALFEELKQVSHQALAEAPAPTPIIVGSPSTPLGTDVDPNQQTWYHADGVCGFATVVLDSGRTGFAQWLLKNNFGRKWWSSGRTKGVGIDTFDRYGFVYVGQSYEKNRYVASRIAAHLRSKGIGAWVDARID